VTQTEIGSVKRIDTFSWILSLLGMLCLLPFIQPVHDVPISSLYSEWLTFLILWAALLITCFHGDGASSLVLPKIALAGFCLLAVMAVQLVIMPPEYAQQIIIPMCYMVSMCAAIQLGYWIRQRGQIERSVFWIAGFLVVGAGYTVALQFIQLAWPGTYYMPFMMPKTMGANPYGNIAQSNHAATYLAIGWAAGYYLLSRGELRFRFYLPFSFLLICGIILTGQRSGLIYLSCLSVLFWCFSTPTATAGGRPRRAAWILSTPVIYLLTNYMLSGLFRYLGQDFVAATQRLESGWDERLQMLRVGWSLFLQAPWFGIGWGRLASYQYSRADVLATLPTNHVHNLIVQLLAETGIFCTVVVLGLVLLWLARLIKEPASREKVFTIGMVIVLGLHSLIEYPLWYAYFLLPLGLFAGMFESQGIRLKLRPIWGQVIAKGMSFAAIGILSCAFLEILYVTDMHTRRTWIPYSPVMRYMERLEMTNMPTRFFFKPYIDYIDSTGADYNTWDLPKKMALNQRLLNTLISNNIIVRQSIYLVLAGRDAEAKTAFLRMRKIFPAKTTAEMLGVIQHAAGVAKNPDLTAFSAWATELVVQK
jgi:O-antigen ligase